jgi:hypothetical protein
MYNQRGAGNGYTGEVEGKSGGLLHQRLNEMHAFGLPHATSRFSFVGGMDLCGRGMIWMECRFDWLAAHASGVRVRLERAKRRP